MVLVLCAKACPGQTLLPPSIFIAPFYFKYVYIAMYEITVHCRIVNIL